MALSSYRSNFYSQYTMLSLFRDISLLAIYAIGETIVIIAGGIDLSLGSLLAFTGMLLAYLVTTTSEKLVPGVAIVVAVLVTMIAALGIGGVHASLVHFLRLPPFVVTLGSLLIFRSLTLKLSNQVPITLEKYPSFINIARGNLFDKTSFAIPVPLILMIVIAIGMTYLLKKARIGRYVYAMGSNEQATRLSGIDVYRVRLFAYGMSALLGGIAGILLAGNDGQAHPSSATGYELDAVAAAVIGGANLNGGQGTILGAVLGTVLLRVIMKVINFLVPQPDQWRGTIVGGVLLLAVLVTALQQRKSRT